VVSLPVEFTATMPENVMLPNTVSSLYLPPRRVKGRGEELRGRGEHKVVGVAASLP